MNKIYVWGIPIRLFHWLLVISLISAYILSEYFLNWHVTFGITAGILTLLRIIYGLIGPRYSNFKDFPVRFSKIKQYVYQERKNSIPTAGHNPMASIIMLVIMMLVVFVACTGMLTLGQEYESGYFAASSLMSFTEWEDIHEVFVNLLIVSILIHLIGLILDWIIFRKKSAWRSMFTGHKFGISGEDSTLSIIQKLYVFLWFLIPLVFFIFSLIQPPLDQSLLNEQEEYEDSHEYEGH